MKNSFQWETKSLDWIHKVREEMDKEIQKKGLSPSQWVKEKGRINLEELCRSLGLDKVKIANTRRKSVSVG